MNRNDDSRRIKTTRVTIVPTDGSPVQEFYAEEFLISYQDQGRTLKLFATGDGRRARAENAAALGRDVAAAWPRG